MATLPKELQTAYQRWEMNSFDRVPEPEPVHLDIAPQQEALPDEPPAPNWPSEDELAAIREQARLEGFDAGHAAGYADAQALGREESAAEIANLQSIAATFAQALTQADEHIANDMLELTLHLARNMLRTALAVKPELIIPVIRDAISYLPVLQQPAVLMLHPDDARLVRDTISDELDKGGWRVADDANIERGGCKIDTASNQIDAQVEVRWQRLANALGKNDVEWLER
ncbi:flagellar assembly protein FliH [Massilia antarctica]|uniref:flagellar assembly protein FliH n=1 Tax=Massilia antarctica TaxID=2765360 RepID=UPI0006BB973F|nr:flagellar assembly protein FliH [Massilia sp. H27-R4]MCY0911403.1 flagellar assembly protein FliH [Massilia sp. H27-R4]CUI04994.1 Flagellar assembly protein FliH [Janthinobacterium sp. CG23_2]CUU28780.1 Flagellar assembly protein FliH [Janthinobacterium sp. CG23_2]